MSITSQSALIWKRVCNNKSLLQYEIWFPYAKHVWIVPLVGSTHLSCPSIIKSCSTSQYRLIMQNVNIKYTLHQRDHLICIVDMIDEYSLQCRCWNGDSIHVIINMLHIFIPFMYETPIVDIFEFRCFTSYSKVHP